MDDLTGILDNSVNIDIIQYKTGLLSQYKRSVDDPYNEGKDDLVTYFNLILDN